MSAIQAAADILNDYPDATVHRIREINIIQVYPTEKAYFSGQGCVEIPLTSEDAMWTLVDDPEEF